MESGLRAIVIREIDPKIVGRIVVFGAERNQTAQHDPLAQRVSTVDLNGDFHAKPICLDGDGWITVGDAGRSAGEERQQLGPSPGR